MGSIIHTTGTVQPKGTAMSSAAYLDEAAEIARRLEDRNARKLGCIRRAREAIARKVGGGFVPGTLETLRKGRLKRLDGWARDRLRDLLVREIEREIEALTHELEIYRALAPSSGGPQGASEILEAEAAVARARAALDAALGRSSASPA